MVWSPLAGGLLSGKYGRDGTRERLVAAVWRSISASVDKDRAFDCVDVMRIIAESKGFRGTKSRWRGCCTRKR